MCLRARLRVCVCVRVQVCGSTDADAERRGAARGAAGVQADDDAGRAQGGATRELRLDAMMGKVANCRAGRVQDICLRAG